MAAVLLPPLGLHLAAARQRDFWIGSALTAFGFLPGVAFALYTLFQRRGPAVGR